MRLLFVQPLDNAKNKLLVFCIELVKKAAYNMGFVTQLRIIPHRFISDKILSGYTQCLGYFNSCFNGRHLPSFVQVVVETVLTYTGFCRKFLDEHTGVKQFGFQVFLEPHDITIVGEKA